MVYCFRSQSNMLSSEFKVYYPVTHGINVSVLVLFLVIGIILQKVEFIVYICSRGRPGGARSDRGIGGRDRKRVNGRGQGRGGQRSGKKGTVEKSAEELDKELDTYHAEAMHIS